MKKILLIAILLTGGYFAYNFLSDSKHISSLYPTIPISEINEKPSSFTGRTLNIEAKVIESSTLMNYTKSTISNSGDNQILLIGKKPYKVGEQINIEAHLYILYQQQGKQCAILVDDDFKMFNGILDLP